jgi:nitrogen fixation protein FixH
MTRRDRMIPWYFVLFFVVLAIIDGVFVSIAVRTHTGVVTENAYEKGLAYNRVVKAQAAQAALGWQGGVVFHRTGPRTGEVALHVRDISDKPLKVESGVVRITRPTQAGMDFEAVLNQGSAVLVFPRSGLWELRVFATVAGKPYQVAKRIVVE